MLNSLSAIRRAPMTATGGLFVLAAFLMSGQTAVAGGPSGTSKSVASHPSGPQAGIATYYGAFFHGKLMANGKRFNMYDPTTTASNAWPLGTRLRVRRVAGGPWDATLSPAERKRYIGRSIVVTVTDRGHFSHALDLSQAAFALLGRPSEGVIHVQIEPLGR